MKKERNHHLQEYFLRFYDGLIWIVNNTYQPVLKSIFTFQALIYREKKEELFDTVWAGRRNNN